MNREIETETVLRWSVRVLGTIVLLAAIAPFVVYAFPGIVGADYGFVALSGSMAPAIGPGDAIIVEEVAPANIEQGDVVTFQKGGDAPPTTHRVQEVVQTEQGIALRTSGDANPTADPQLVPGNSVIGTVAEFHGHLLVIPYIGHVVLFAETALGFATLVVLPLVLLVGTEIWSMIRSEDQRTSTSGSSDVMVDATATDESDASAGPVEKPPGITISPTELVLLVPILTAFAAYSIWTVTQLFSPVTVAVSMGSATLLFASGLIYRFGDWSEEQATALQRGDVERVKPVVPIEDRSGTEEERFTPMLTDGKGPTVPMSEDRWPGGAIPRDEGELAAATPVESERWSAMLQTGVPSISVPGVSPVVPVESRSALVETARSNEWPIAWDPGRAAFVTIGGPVSYAYTPAETSRWHRINVGRPVRGEPGGGRRYDGSETDESASDTDTGADDARPGDPVTDPWADLFDGDGQDDRDGRPGDHDRPTGHRLVANGGGWA